MIGFIYYLACFDCRCIMESLRVDIRPESIKIYLVSVKLTVIQWRIKKMSDDKLVKLT